MKKARQPLVKAFAANVRAVRQARGWSQDELAEKAWLRHCRIDTLEAGGGGSSVNLHNMARVAKALGVDLSELCRRDRR